MKKNIPFVNLFPQYQECKSDIDNDQDGIPDDLQIDTNGDGLPDFYENLYGLDPNEPSDASGDMDGDGFTHLEEYEAGTDPTRDELPPELTIPADISMGATGRMLSLIHI